MLKDGFWEKATQLRMATYRLEQEYQYSRTKFMSWMGVIPILLSLVFVILRLCRP